MRGDRSRHAPKKKTSLARASPKKRTAPRAPAKPTANRALELELDVHREELATQNDDLRRANAALSAVKERYAQLYDTAPVAYFTLDAAGRVVEANLAGAELLDVTRNLLFGRTFDELIVPSSRASFRAFRKRVLEQGGRPTHDTFIAMNKRRFPAQLAAARIGDGATTASECLLCITDETERRGRESERRDLEARVADTQRVEALGVLAGGIAHDFNNILGVALGVADIALEDEAEPAAREALQEIRGAVARAADLSAQMLAYTGRGHRTPEPVDVTDAIRSMSGLLASSAPKGSLVLDLADDLPLVIGERAQIQQIVLNLVVNAAEAIVPETGRIILRTRSAPAPAVSSARPQRGVVLEVQDDGVGMDDATRQRAFDPFFSTKFVGRGLGLAVVHGNVRAHGGTVAVESRPNAGTTFTVHLPTPPGPDLRRRSEPANDMVAEEPWRGSGLVLVVDDEPAVRTTVGRILQRIGFDVCYAGDGLEALEVARDPPAALVAVILDMTMPRLGGEATLAQLKALDRTLPVILMSGFSNASLGTSIAALADGFLPKPFSLRKITEAMRVALPTGARTAPSSSSDGTR